MGVGFLDCYAVFCGVCAMAHNVRRYKDEVTGCVLLPFGVDSDCHEFPSKVFVF